MLPTFDSDVDLALKAANERYAQDRSVTLLKKGIKSKILDRLADQIYKMTAYADQDQLKEVAEALCKVYPGISDKVSTKGCQMWLNSITYKMAAYRQVMRKLGRLDVEINGNRRCITTQRNMSALPPAKGIKKARRGEVNWQPDLPDGEDETSLEQHRMSMITEMKKARPDATMLSKLMVFTYAQRRLDINSQVPVSALQERWPALFRHAEVII